MSVVDIHALHDRAKRFVVGAVLKRMFEEKELLGTSRPLAFVVLDELNKYAPREGSGPIKEVLLDISERGRSLGIVLVGAQQTASEVESRIVANAALRVVGRLDAAEAERPEYGFLSAAGRGRAGILSPRASCTPSGMVRIPGCAPNVIKNSSGCMEMTASSSVRCTRPACGTWHNENIEMRKFSSPIAARNLMNDIPNEAVDALLDTARKNVSTFQRYFKLKARHAGMKKLRRYDIYAPVARSRKTYKFDAAANMVLDSFAAFDPKVADLAKRVFDENRLDSEIRKGKRGGAFCWPVLPELTPWVLVNYQGTAREVATLAHGLGHAMHSLRSAMPWFFAVFLLISLSSIAVPGTNGFVGEFLILIGAWTFSPWLVAVASLGVILAAAYVLWMVKRVFYGELANPKNQGLPDLSAREAAVLLPLVVLAIVMGIASPIFTRRIEPSADALVRQVREATRAAPAALARADAPAPGPGGGR